MTTFVKFLLFLLKLLLPLLQLSQLGLAGDPVHPVQTEPGLLNSTQYIKAPIQYTTAPSPGGTRAPKQYTVQHLFQAEPTLLNSTIQI
jgi:hypothetical protein